MGQPPDVQAPLPSRDDEQETVVLARSADAEAGKNNSGTAGGVAHNDVRRRHGHLSGWAHRRRTAFKPVAGKRHGEVAEGAGSVRRPGAAAGL